MSKVALVTGGMGGLGHAICYKLAEMGHKVIASHSPGNKKVEAWIKEMQEHGFSNIGTVEIEVTDFDSCAAGVKKVNEMYGPVEILVNNAGITRDSTFKKMNRQAWDEVMNTNLGSVFNMCKQVTDDMVARSWGRIINVSSVNGQKGAFGQCNYAAAKAGMHGFTKALALELAKKGVTINTISPGYIGTKMVTDIPEEILATKILPQIPVGRLGFPNEIAGLVAYLSSNEAAFITGANISINGGQHMY